MQVGDRYHVKHTAVLRKYGIRCVGLWRAPGDDIAWPGDIGTVTDSSYTHTPSGERVPFYTLEFDRGRRIVLDYTDDGRIVWPGFGVRIADFLYLRPAKVALVDA